MAVSVFLDTSVLLGGLIDLGPQSGAPQSIMHGIAARTLHAPGTAWHCCLEFYSVATRLPAEYRLTPADACLLLEEEVFGRMEVVDLPAKDRRILLRNASRDGIAGGRLYDAHIAEIARAAGATVIVTDNRRHFVSSLKHGIRVETPAELLAGLKTR